MSIEITGQWKAVTDTGSGRIVWTVTQFDTDRYMLVVNAGGVTVQTHLDPAGWAEFRAMVEQVA